MLLLNSKLVPLTSFSKQQRQAYIKHTVKFGIIREQHKVQVLYENKASAEI
jgi:hypothetical protein